MYTSMGKESMVFLYSNSSKTECFGKNMNMK